MKKISIIVPVYFNQDNLLPLYTDLKEKVLEKLIDFNLDYELVFIDDGSKDNSYSVMQNLQKLDNKIVLLKLARNFGEHSAILAGLSKCTGDFAVRKAADLQEPSEMIIDLIKEYNKGYKVVLALRESREDKWHEKLLSNMYTNVIKKIALKNMPKGGVDSFLIDRQIIDLLVDWNKSNEPVTEQILWSGFDYGSVYYKRKKREIGTSKWTLAKKIKMTLDSILGYSYFPIRVISVTGILSFFSSLLAIIYLIFLKLNDNITVDGYTSIVIICISTFGIIMLSLGVLGEYIWRVLDVSKRTPPFIIDKIELKKKE